MGHESLENRIIMGGVENCATTAVHAVLRPIQARSVAGRDDAVLGNG
uniref:Uncharacterized protein n=1 Tax=Candidatus Kentrum sp. UNK TaxID=2126344 RepID=A0A451B325_9GAMM|nr:MAG: hypothetical protein BECKUNK1418G_GA0071005_11169 [Candidatus Kentron sp. UNK]VFK72667.1 MAG: hypothetical protein BECKUNK1418H_GA0071006_11297 [Candidatus Kentron sp. UNK]